MVSLLVICLAMAVASAATHIEPWHSSLYPPHWEPGWTDTEGRFLHDFSHAGYRMGEAALPTHLSGPRVDVTEAPYFADNTGNDSATAAIQQALDDVGNSGGGTVYLPPGTYRLTYPSPLAKEALAVQHDGVILQGAGQEHTFLFLDETLSRSKAFIRVAPQRPWDWYEPLPGTVQFLADDVKQPTMTVRLAEPPGVAAGDWIALTHDTTEQWVREHKMIGLWPPGAVAGQLFYRQVVAVDEDLHTVTFDVPTRYPLAVRDNARMHMLPPPLQQVGLADFSFAMRQHPGKGWGTDDHGKAGTGAYDVHGSRGIVMRGVVNGWITDVSTYLPPENDRFHLHSIGVEVVQSRFVTVRRVSISHPQYLGGGGNGYPFVISGQDSLYDSIVAVDGRHPITVTRAHANGNVVLGGYIKSTVSLASDFHAFMSVANLIDGLTIDKERFEAGDRSHASGTGGLSHGHGSSQSVFWNIRGLAYKGDGQRGDVIVWSEQFGWGYVIGTQGPASAVGAGTGIRARPVDFVEGEGQGESLIPQSLYTDQLQRRLMREGKRQPADATGVTKQPEV